MSVVFASIGMSLDGRATGPDADAIGAAGNGGQAVDRAGDAVAGRGGPGATVDGDDAADDTMHGRAGAFVMGRRMFDEGESRWPDTPPFRAPVFVLTSRPREPWVRQGGTTFTFVTDGIASAVERARAAAGGRDVQIAGGADTVRQCLEAGLIDELEIQLAPVLLGEGERLLDDVGVKTVRLRPDRVVDSSEATYLRYRVLR